MAHNSAGPKHDILASKDEKYGILCEDSSYLEELKQVCLALYSKEQGKYTALELIQNMENGRNKMKNMVSNEAFAQ